MRQLVENVRPSIWIDAPVWLGVAVERIGAQLICQCGQKTRSSKARKILTCPNPSRIQAIFLLCVAGLTFHPIKWVTTKVRPRLTVGLNVSIVLQVTLEQKLLKITQVLKQKCQESSKNNYVLSRWAYFFWRGFWRSEAIICTSLVGFWVQFQMLVDTFQSYVTWGQVTCWTISPQGFLPCYIWQSGHGLFGDDVSQRDLGCKSWCLPYGTALPTDIEHKIIR